MFGYEDELKKEIEELRAANQKLRGALAFYASKENWISEVETDGDAVIVLSDMEPRELEGYVGNKYDWPVGGKRARQALAQIDDEPTPQTGDQNE